ncbi:YkgJ family cysteine cluster protein [Nannocystis pusilla]|uniref:YkgJ family cysteine cluster protein n=1 Tax=Nannocystis pusilla TaxID=889268 RepID=UPI003DA3A14D
MVMQLYFPFADGAFGYHCRECGFRCCKGAGFFPTVAEHTFLSERHPSLALFTLNAARSAQDRLMAVANHDCFFLADSGQCKIHTQHGRQRKPLFCRLFPAVRFTRVGARLVVDLHDLCPIRPFHAGSEDFVLRHAELCDDLHAELETVLALAEPAPTDEAGVPRLEPARLDYEAWLRDLVQAEPQLGLFEYCAIDDWNAQHGWPAARPPSAELERGRQEARARLRAMAALLLCEDELDVDRIACERLLLALAPRVRLALASRLPPALGSAELWRLAHRMVLALALYLEVVAATAGSAVTTSTVNHALKGSLLLLALLAQLDRVPTFGASPLHAVVLAPPAAIEHELLTVVEQIHGPTQPVTLAQMVSAASSSRLTRSRVLRNLAELSSHLRFTDAGEEEPSR